MILVFNICELWYVESEYSLISYLIDEYKVEQYITNASGN